MNIRKPVDYFAMYRELDALLTAKLPQMKLYCKIGKLVSYRPEKGAAVATAEYLGKTYPDVSGFSPRNLRRMRDFYRAYHDTPEVLAQAMTIGWTQNVVILEAELTLQERSWYIQATRQFRWSKSTLIRMIQERAHETTTLDTAADPCYISSTGGDEDGTKEPSRAFLQGLRDAGVQRELQRQGSRGSHLLSLFPPFASAAGGTGDTASIGKSSIAPPDQKRNDVAEKPDPRSPARDEALGLYGLCGKISSFGTKPEEAGTVHPNPGIKHRRRYHDSYDAPVYVKESYQVSRTPPAIIRIQQDGTRQTIEPPSKILPKLLKWTVHTLEIFWWGEDYCGPVDVELEDIEPSLWNVHVECSNGEGSGYKLGG